MVVSADLGSSSSYSIELLFRTGNYTGADVWALKVVVDKVSLRVVLMQRLVGPKRKEKSVWRSRYERREREGG